MSLRIAVNALYLIPGGVGGTEIYLRNLLDALAAADESNLYFVFVNRETDPGLVPHRGNFVRMHEPVSAVNRPMRLAWEQTVLPLRLRKLRIDCILNPGFTAPAMAPCPNVTVFHDLQHKRHPEHFRWFDRPAWEFFLWLASRTSRFLLADSEPTRDDLIRYYKIAPDRVRLALLGVEQEFFSIAGRRGALKPYVLCASTLHPHKNIERLVRVFARFRAERPDLDLVMAGVRGFRATAIESLVSQLGLEQHVRITGWIPRTDLYRLFRFATAFIYPSTFEGFGLPVLEAMAAGVPLACSDIEPLRTNTAGHAFLFDPHSDEQMLEALRCVVSSTEHVSAARERASQFTWKACAQATLKAVVDAVSAADPQAGSSRLSSNRGT